jgi:Anti-sigma-K factor rskA
MFRTRRRDRSPFDENVELAALADGWIAPERRAPVVERVAASSELAERLAVQERAVALARSVAAEVEAPASLRASVDAQRRPRRAPVSGRLVLIVGVAAAAAVAVIGLAVIGSGTPHQRYSAALAPTSLAPGAGGGATLTKTAWGWRIELHATGLARRDGGRFYEAWLRNAAGALVPIGTFNDGRRVTLWAGVSPKQFTTLTVTREQADRNQASSGEKVLVGAVETRG